MSTTTEEEAGLSESGKSNIAGKNLHSTLKYSILSVCWFDSNLGNFFILLEKIMSKLAKFFVLAAILCLNSLYAMSIGREGEPFFIEDIQWQHVCYKNNDAGFTATIPGEPRSGIANSDAYTHSNYKGVNYEIHCSLSKRIVPWKKYELFVQEVKNAFEEAQVVEVVSDQPNVKYVVDVYFINTSKAIRLFCSHNCLYWAIVEGGDLSLASLFFDSIQITN